MQNVHAASTPEFHVLSNGALVFTVSIILYTGKRISLHVQGNCASIHPPFSAHMTQFTRKFSATFERALNRGLETTVSI
jgi:hypothetical protein